MAIFTESVCLNWFNEEYDEKKWFLAANKFAIVSQQKISKIKGITKVEIVSYKDCSLDIAYTSNNYKDIVKSVCNIMKETVAEMEKKFNKSFYWDVKVCDEKGMLICLDTDYGY